MLNIRRYQWWKNKIQPHARRIVLSASVFVLASASLVFHAPLYNSDVSVEFGVVNRDGKSYYQYPKEDSSEIKKFKKKYTFLAGVVGFTNAGRISSFKQTDYSYSGVSNWIDDGKINNKACWRIKFTTSGTFTPKKRTVIDIFIVAGGGGGGAEISSGSGGGGGYTGTWLSIVINANQAYPIVIGGGGSPNVTGGSTSGFGYSKNGGVGGRGNGSYSYSSVAGGAGGSGGGGNGDGTDSQYWNGGNGGQDGATGAKGQSGTSNGGVGQLTTTREFGEAGAQLYADGGGGSGYTSSKTGGTGGSGLGGRGYGSAGAATSGQVNTGSGGGGGYRGSGVAGSGGSGILIIRNTRS